MAAFTAWHGRLVPNGLQLGLFYGVWDHDNPDFVPRDVGRDLRGRALARPLLLLALGGRALWRDRAALDPAVRPQRLAWLAVGATALGTLIVCVFLRPAAAVVIFGLTIAVMLAAGLALAALVRRHRLERAAGVAAVAVPVRCCSRLLPAPLPERVDAARRRLPPAAAALGADRVRAGGSP